MYENGIMKYCRDNPNKIYSLDWPADRQYQEIQQICQILKEFNTVAQKTISMFWVSAHAFHEYTKFVRDNGPGGVLAAVH